MDTSLSGNLSITFPPLPGERMLGVVAETAEAAPAAGLEAPGPEAVVVPVAPAVAGGAVALPTTCKRPPHRGGHRSC